MYLTYERKRRIHRIALTSLFVGLVLYFAYHAISGERGAFALITLSDDLEKTKAELDLVRAERINLEHRVALMRPDSLDLDLLDEEARKTLGYGLKDEEVYMYQPTPQSDPNTP